jgi:RNA polymerase sigma-70 factor (ECF subfamily)
MKNQEHIIKLVEGCLQNDQLCQAKLFNIFYPKMVNVCVRYVNDVDMAHDIVQESFIKIFNNLETYRLSNSFEGWIKRIIVNASIDELRKIKTKRISRDTDVNTLRIEEEVYDDSISNERVQLMLDAIEKLPKKYKAVFKMFVLEDLSHKEISEMLGIHEGTSKSNFFKAKAKLRNQLKNKIYGNS